MLIWSQLNAAKMLYMFLIFSIHQLVEYCGIKLQKGQNAASKDKSKMRLCIHRHLVREFATPLTLAKTIGDFVPQTHDLAYLR